MRSWIPTLVYTWVERKEIPSTYPPLVEVYNPLLHHLTESGRQHFTSFYTSPKKQHAWLGYVSRDFLYSKYIPVGFLLRWTFSKWDTTILSEGLNVSWFVNLNYVSFGGIFRGNSLQLGVNPIVWGILMLMVCDIYPGCEVVSPRTVFPPSWDIYTPHVKTPSRWFFNVSPFEASCLLLGSLTFHHLPRWHPRELGGDN